MDTYGHSSDISTIIDSSARNVKMIAFTDTVTETSTSEVGVQTTSKSTMRQVMAVMAACLGPFSCGFVLGYTSPTSLDLEKEGILTESQLSWFGSLINIGALFGAPVGSFFVPRYGRKHAIMSTALPFTVGWLLIAIGSNVSMMYSGRILVGFATGFQSMATPVYIAEVSQNNLRGRLGACNQISVIVAIVIVYAAGIAISWRWLAIIGSIASFIMVICLCFVPETPQWYIKQHQRDQAIASLSWLRGGTDVLEEFHQMERDLEQLKGRKFSLTEFCKKDVYKPLIISCIVMVFQQLSGILPITFYMGEIFDQAGFSGNPNLPPIIIGVVQLVVTILALQFIDKLGRRKLLIISAAIMCTSLVSMGTYFYLIQIKGIHSNWLSISSLVVYVIGFSFGWGAIPWIILGELFSLNVRGFCSGISTAVNWAAAFIVTYYFNDIEHVAGSYTVFWIFAGSTIFSVIFVILFLPETKQKSLDEIRKLFLN